MSFLWGKIRGNDGDQSCSSSSSSDEGIDTSAQDDALKAPSSSLIVAVSSQPQETDHTACQQPQMTWEQAHRLACMQNGSLKVTRFQIESQFPIGQEIPQQDSLLLWYKESIVDQLAALIKPNYNHVPENMSESSSSSFLWKTLRGIWTLARTNQNDDEEEEESEEEEEQQETPKLDHLQLGIVHLTMARSLLGYLTSIIKTNLDEIVPLSPASVWNKWVMQQEKAADQVLLSSLSVDELQILFQALERTGVPVSVHTTPSNEFVVMTGTSEDMPSRLVEYDLNQTALRLEQEHLALEEQSKKYRKAALAAKQRNGNPIPSMKLYKLCEAQLAHKQNHLLQIETVRMTLHQAVNNRSVVQVMRSARVMLHDIHKELENVHDVMDDLKDVMQDHEEVSSALQSTVMTDTDEEELLQELQGLSLDAVNDNQPNAKENSVVSNQPETKKQPTRVDAGNSRTSDASATEGIETSGDTGRASPSPVPVI